MDPDALWQSIIILMRTVCADPKHGYFCDIADKGGSCHICEDRGDLIDDLRRLADHLEKADTRPPSNFQNV